MARDDDGTVRRLVLMPDVGNELIWSSYSVRQQGVGYACCNIQYTCDLQRELQAVGSEEEKIKKAAKR